MEAKNGKSAHKKTSSKTSANSKSSKTKKAKVVVPKMNNVVKPQSLSLEEWQVALRQQQAEKEVFAIRRTTEDEELLCLSNFSQDGLKASLPCLVGQYEDVFTGEIFEANAVWLAPYQYRWCKKISR